MRRGLEAKVKGAVECFVRRERAAPSELWTAICFDFDIVVNGPSRQRAVTALAVAVRGYVDDATSESEPGRTGLLRRRAPLLTRLAWRLSPMAQRFDPAIS